VVEDADRFQQDKDAAQELKLSRVYFFSNSVS